MVSRRHRRTAILAPATLVAAAAAATAMAVPALASYPPPSIHLLCTAAANGGTLEGSVCALPPGAISPPGSYSATIVAGLVGRAGASVSFALTSGSLPPGLSLSASTGASATIADSPTKAGVYSFTIKATDGGLTSTLAYEITVTTQGAPDQLLCDPADNGGFLEDGTCVLPDAVIGLPYQGALVTSHKAGGSLSIVSGSLPAGLSLPATFTGSGDIVGGTPATPGTQPSGTFTVQGTGDQGQPLYQAYTINVDQNVPLSINASGGTNLSGTVGQPFAQNFFVSGGAAPYTWSLASGQLPPGLTLQTSSDPRDASNQLAGTPATAGTYTFTMRLSDYPGQTATQQFTLVISP